MNAMTPIHTSAEVRTIIANCFALPALASQHQDAIREAMIASICAEARAESPKPAAQEAMVRVSRPATSPVIVRKCRTAAMAEGYARHLEREAPAKKARDEEILALIEKGMNRGEIAAALGVASSTVTRRIKIIAPDKLLTRAQALAIGKRKFTAKQREQHEARSKVISAMLKEGWSRDEIGAAVGLKAHRLAQIIKEVAPEHILTADQAVRRAIDGQVKARKNAKAARVQRTATMVLAGAAYSDIIAALGCSNSMLKDYVRQARDTGLLTQSDIDAVSRKDANRVFDERRAKVRELLDAGLSGPQIAEALGLTRGNAFAIIAQVKAQGWRKQTDADRARAVLDAALPTDDGWIITAAQMAELRALAGEGRA